MGASPAAIRRLPKSDLHSHIDGSIPLKELFTIAKSHRRKVLTRAGGELLSAGSFAEHVRGRSHKNLLDEIIDRFYPIVGLMQTEEILREVGVAYVKELKKNNTVYSEGRFAPQYHTREGMTYEQVITSMAEGLREGSETYGIRTNLIVAIGRETDAATAVAVTRAAVSSRRAVGLDLGGPEAGHPPDKFREAFRIAAQGGLNRTVHAGEGAGSLSQNLHNIRSSIEGLNAQRVGHAIDISKDSSLMEFAKERSITIEMNPVSNMVLGRITDPKELMIDSLLESGLSVTVNSDDPALWPHGSIDDVLAAVCESYRFSMKEVDLLITNSIRGSFASNGVKDALLDDYSHARSVQA